MKCLSLVQPYAQLVVLGEKTIELRKWNTSFRGRFLVHASKKTDMKACGRFGMNVKNLVNGAVIGSANLYGVKRYASRDEFMADSIRHLAMFEEFGSSKYGFLLDSAKTLDKPVYIRGSLNFFDVEL